VFLTSAGLQPYIDMEFDSSSCYLFELNVDKMMLYFCFIFDSNSL
jgi:hypothetical protein